MVKSLPSEKPKAVKDTGNKVYVIEFMRPSISKYWKVKSAHYTKFEAFNALHQYEVAMIDALHIASYRIVKYKPGR